MNEFDIEEREHGIALIPRDRASRPYVEGPSITKELRELALVETQQLTPAVAANAPKHRGTRVRGGELYARGEGDRLVLKLLGSTAFTMILPNLASDHDAVLAVVEEMDAQWDPHPA